MARPDLIEATNELEGAQLAAPQLEQQNTVKSPDVPSTPAPSREPVKTVDLAHVEKQSNASAMDFMVAHLTAHPEATYEEVSSAAELEGYAVFPITYGRARTLAGLSPRTKSTEGSPAMGFMAAVLKRNPATTFQEMKAAAAKEGLEVHPITFGNARRQAGLTKQSKPAVRPVDQALLRPKLSAPARQTPAVVAPIRPAQTGTGSPSALVSNLVEHFQRLEGNRDLIRDALDRIAVIARETVEKLR